MGRPAKPEKERRRSKTLIAWNEEELSLVAEAAAALSLTTSAFLRMASLDRAKEVLGLPRPPHRE